MTTTTPPPVDPFTEEARELRFAGICLVAAQLELDRTAGRIVDPVDAAREVADAARDEFLAAARVYTYSTNLEVATDAADRLLIAGRRAIAAVDYLEHLITHHRGDHQ